MRLRPLRGQCGRQQRYHTSLACQGDREEAGGDAAAELQVNLMIHGFKDAHWSPQCALVVTVNELNEREKRQ